MIKQILQYIAFGVTIFLMATIDSYSIQTVMIMTAVFLTALGFWLYQNKGNTPTIKDIPKSKADDDLAKWLKSTIKKIDKMDKN